MAMKERTYSSPHRV